MKHNVVVGTVCFIQDGQNVLLLRRSRPPMDGLYTGVGGKTEFGEDIHASCVREIFEETGLRVERLQLKGILKTLLHNENSSWLLCVYVAEKPSGVMSSCDEGELFWVPIDRLYSYDLIGFIRTILPYVLDERAFFEGTIVHDHQGRVIDHTLHVSACRENNQVLLV